ncbi:phosphoribosylformylglycinamidine synthase-associated small membrane protein [Roseibium litorale]|uniref:Phosphoribosylformylglycinamidine synthase n=1 Tax=Roseibium litorale TaxID=2803841 RepID=A0ABR9CI36_9HYPH|nr:phosphoribosylformylglycinamidine synthase-associated small membrane protein [Roseibium litorale]MBD8890349.1 phosphoribosylformylglycinamidine synthase [Roseibium litorale]
MALDEDSRKALRFMAIKAALFILLPATCAALAVVFLL